MTLQVKAWREAYIMGISLGRAPRQEPLAALSMRHVLTTSAKSFRAMASASSRRLFNTSKRGMGNSGSASQGLSPMSNPEQKPRLVDSGDGEVQGEEIEPSAFMLSLAKSQLWGKKVGAPDNSSLRKQLKLPRLTEATESLDLLLEDVTPRDLSTSERSMNIAHSIPRRRELRSARHGKW